MDSAVLHQMEKLTGAVLVGTLLSVSCLPLLHSVCVKRSHLTSFGLQTVLWVGSSSSSRLVNLVCVMDANDARADHEHQNEHQRHPTLLGIRMTEQYSK